MPAPQVRSDYDQLQIIQNTFNAQADAVSKMNHSIKGHMDTLQGGDWIGEGARKFYSEMNDQVMPSLNRLHRALAEASQVTQKISSLMQQAEQEASNAFKIT